MAVSAFVGFESPTTLGGEAHRPFVSVPRAITWTPILMGVLCLLAVTAQDAALQEAPITITASSTPLSDLFSQVSPASAAVLDLGIAASWFGCAIASVNALARIFFCMGREGVAPRIVGRTHPVFRTPSTAIMVIMPVVAIVPIALIISGASPELGLVNLFTLGAYGYLGSYILGQRVPALLLAPDRREHVRQLDPRGGNLARRRGGVLDGGGGIDCAQAICRPSSTPVSCSPSIIYATFLRLRLPGRLASVGIYDETRERTCLTAAHPMTYRPTHSGPSTTSNPLRILEIVARFGTGTTAKEVTDALQMPQATAYRILNSLVADEYLARTSDLRGFALRTGNFGADYGCDSPNRSHGSPRPHRRVPRRNRFAVHLFMFRSASLESRRSGPGLSAPLCLRNAPVSARLRRRKADACRTWRFGFPVPERAIGEADTTHHHR